MSYLKMALQAMKAATDEGDTGVQRHKPAGKALNHTPPTKAPAATLPERILTCGDCPHFEANHGLNPQQGWGFCCKLGRGRYACAKACEAILS